MNRRYEVRNAEGKVIASGYRHVVPEPCATAEPFTMSATLRRDDGSVVSLGRFTSREDGA